MDEYVFALGSESSPYLRRLLGRVPPESALKVGRLGSDLIGTRSDYGPFRDRHVPYLFFSTGPHPDYHRPGDTPDRINYGKLCKIARWISDLTWRLANDAETPVWQQSQGGSDVEEARTVLLLVSRVLQRPKACPLSDEQREAVRRIRHRLSIIVERGKVTAAERVWLVLTARLLMATTF
jgi:hypothetical protein